MFTVGGKRRSRRQSRKGRKHAKRGGSCPCTSAKVGGKRRSGRKGRKSSKKHSKRR